jgi:hypothetical protein
VRLALPEPTTQCLAWRALLIRFSRLGTVMFDTVLITAVEGFSHAALGLPDQALDSEWAWGAYDSEGIRFAFFRTYEELRELAANCAATRALKGPTRSTAQRILAQYHAAYRDLQAVLLGVTASAAEESPSRGEWSARQILSHIVSGEVGFHVVVKYALDLYRSGETTGAQVPDEAWEDTIGLHENSFVAILKGPYDDLITYHQRLHNRILTEFSSIRDSELDAPSLYWEGYELSVRFRLHRFDSHLRQHTIQLEKTLAALGRRTTEVQRLLRIMYAAVAEVEGIAIGAANLDTNEWHAFALNIAARTDDLTKLSREA